MYYIIQNDIALRSWPGVPFAYYRKGKTDAFPLSRDEFELLRKCDGKTPLDGSGLLRQMLERGLIRCSKGEEDVLSDWQKLRVYFNRYMPKMNLAITGRCNCKCRHCFNANGPAADEMTYDEIIRLLDSACACGINAFTITGGEPLLFERLGDVIEAIYARGMFLFEINTNAMLLEQPFLDRLRSIHAEPVFKISFDGIGYHDWMRGVEGAQKTVLDRISLCVRNGFRVCAQINVNRKNLDSVYDTLALMESLGVEDSRIIRTSESPRWLTSAEGLTLDVGEYYDRMLELAVRYMSGSHRMQLNIWQYLYLYPESGSYCFQPVTAFGQRSYSEDAVLCPGARSMIAVGADGEVYPCMQVSGTMQAAGLSLGNVRNGGLRSILTDSEYLKCVCTTVGEKLKENALCRECPYVTVCRGGCPALAYNNLGRLADPMGPDVWKCIFFKQNYPEKCKNALSAFRCLDLQPREAI